MDGSESIWPPDEIIGAGAAVDAGRSSQVASPPTTPARSGSPWASGPDPVDADTVATAVSAGPDRIDVDEADAAWADIAAAEGWGRPGVPVKDLPWAQPPRTVTDRAPSPTAVSHVDAPADQATINDDVRGHGLVAVSRIAVISGDARTGGLVARRLAEMLEYEAGPDALVLDAGADITAPAWRNALDLTERVVLAIDGVGAGPSHAADLLARAGMHDSTAVVLLPPSRRGLSRGQEDIAAIRTQFQTRTRAILFVPNDPQPTVASIAAWRRVIAALA